MLQVQVLVLNGLRATSRLACIGRLGREVAALVSFFMHVSKLHKRTKGWCDWTIIPSLQPARCSDFCKQKAWVSWICCRLTNIYGENVFCQKKVSVSCNKFKDSRRALNDYRNTGGLCHCRMFDKGSSKSQSSWNALQKKKKQSRNASYLLERITAVKECLNF
jgi:hypothetical protein